MASSKTLSEKDPAAARESLQRAGYDHLARPAMDEKALLDRITYDPKIFAGKPIIRGHRLASSTCSAC